MLLKEAIKMHKKNIPKEFIQKTEEMLKNNAKKYGLKYNKGFVSTFLKGFQACDMARDQSKPVANALAGVLIVIEDDLKA